MGSSGVKTFFKFGCLGCAGLLLLAVVVMAILSGTAMFQARSEKVEDRELVQEFPRVETVSEEELSAGEVTLAPETPPGLVVLELGYGEVEIEPADPGEPLRVEGRFDTKSYELVESREQTADGWTYKLKFEPRGFNLSGLRQLFGARPPKVSVYLPRDVPFALDATFEKGPAEVDLGGLWLTETDLNISQGALILDVSEPLREPAERFEVEGHMGALIAKGLGNTSARKMSFNHGMGALVVDLRGEWRTDASVEVQVAMGGGDVRLPEDVGIQGLSDQFTRYNREAEPEMPTLDMHLHFDMGELQVND